MLMLMCDSSWLCVVSCASVAYIACEVESSVLTAVGCRERRDCERTVGSKVRSIPIGDGLSASDCRAFFLYVVVLFFGNRVNFDNNLPCQIYFRRGEASGGAGAGDARDGRRGEVQSRIRESSVCQTISRRSDPDSCFICSSANLARKPSGSAIITVHTTAHVTRQRSVRRRASAETVDRPRDSSKLSTDGQESETDYGLTRTACSELGFGQHERVSARDDAWCVFHRLCVFPWGRRTWPQAKGIRRPR